MRSPNRLAACAAFLAVSVVLISVPSAIAQTDKSAASEDERIAAARKEREEKERLAREAASRAAEQQKKSDEAATREETLRRDRRDAVQREQRHAQELRRLGGEIARLVAEESVKRDALKRQSARRDQVVAALLRLSGNEPAFLVALPGNPLDNVQGALAFREMEKELRRQSATLSLTLQELARLRQSTEETHKRADGERASMAEETARLEKMLAESADEQRRATALRQKEAELAEKLRNEARDRGELIELLVKERKQREAREAAERKAQEEARREAERKAHDEAQRKIKEAKDAEARKAAEAARDQLAALPAPSKAEPQRNIPGDVRSVAPARGGMLNPVTGRIVRQFGQTDDGGSASKGVVFDAVAAARVVAPYDGQVVYAGPFRGYGRILIIEHAGGYHTLLSGLGRIDCAVGQWIVAGEPVAVMGDQGGAGLYVELRRDGQPVNPVPWLAAGSS